MDETKVFYGKLEGIETVTEFKYLGVKIKDDGQVNLEDAIQKLISKAFLPKRLIR